MLDLIKNRYLQSLLVLDKFLEKKGKTLDMLLETTDPILFAAFQRSDVSAASRVWAAMKDSGLTLEHVREQVGINTRVHERVQVISRPIRRVCPKCEGQMRLIPGDDEDSQWLCESCSHGIYESKSWREVIKDGR